MVIGIILNPEKAPCIANESYLKGVASATIMSPKNNTPAALFAHWQLNTTPKMQDNTV